MHIQIINFRLKGVSEEDYAVVCSYVKRVAVRVNALLSGDFGRWWGLGRYYRLATELAFNKRRLTRFPTEEGTQAHIAQLRKQVIELGNQL